MSIHRFAARLAPFTLALSLALVQPAFAATGSINAPDVRFRSEPALATQASVIRLVGEGTALEVLSRDNEWARVKIGDTIGYVYGIYVTEQAPVAQVEAAPPAPVVTPVPVILPTPAASPMPETTDAAGSLLPADAEASAAVTPIPAPDEQTAAVSQEVSAVVDANTLNIRQQASSDAALLGQVVRGQEVALLEPGDEYARIRTVGGVEGFVLNAYLVPVVTSVSRAANELVDELIAHAMTFRGVEYVYAGMSPSGFDCSGFVKYVYQHIGIDTPRSSRDYGAVGVKVARAALLPGDVLLWDTDRDGVTDISHVGIYLGNDKFIHASSTLDSVVVASVSGYRATYLGARRFLE